ncbi:23S rRNA (uracil(1939)-C(5))-methyltransferase RlmD [Candidatus Margulisiibacteriota bacterium]
MELTIKHIERGFGIGKEKRKKYFARNTLPGEVIDVVGSARMRRGYIVDNFHFLKKSELRVDPSCPYFGNCGGCSYQHISRDQELLYKKQYIEELFNDYLSIIKPFKTFNQRYYRNRMDFIIDTTGIGLRAGGRYDKAIPIDTCLIAHEKIMDRKKIVDGVLKKYVTPEMISNLHTHEGEFRYVVMRTNGEHVQTTIITRTNDVPIMKSILDELVEQFPSGDSIYWNTNDALSDVSHGLVTEVRGEHILPISYKDLSFRITPNIFFQTNLEGFQYLASLVEQVVQEIRPSNVIDLFSGMGVFGMITSRHADSVICIDNNEENIQMGKIVSELNDIQNIQFVCEDATKWSKTFSTKADLFIIDPPRSGMTRRTLRMLNELHPEYILYISCNPITQYANIEGLDYTPLWVQPIDMFPWTWHMESVVLLKKNN